LRPFFEKGVKGFELHEEMRMGAFLGHSARNRTPGVHEFAGFIGRATDLAVVSVLAFRLASWTPPDNETIGEEYASLGIEELRHIALFDAAIRAQRRPDLVHNGFVCGCMRTAKMILLDPERFEISDMRGLHLVEKGFGLATFLLCAKHGRSAVGVIAADVKTIMATELLEAHPVVGLEILDEMTEMDARIHVGQATRHENLASLFHPDLRGKPMAAAFPLC
jgi:hypothetical protein